jgi:hypothetical protein
VVMVMNLGVHGDLSIVFLLTECTSTVVGNIPCGGGLVKKSIGQSLPSSHYQSLPLTPG